MNTLWAPWRMEYILRPKADACVFCLPENPDEDQKRLVLYRGRKAFVVMNKFPYANGHLLVAPFRHEGDITGLSHEEHTEIMELAQQSVRILRHVVKAAGFNIGMNLGDVSGAGVLGHVHLHIVPRWPGDASFISVLGETRVIPQHFAELYTQLVPHFFALASGTAGK